MSSRYTQVLDPFRKVGLLQFARQYCTENELLSLAWDPSGRGVAVPVAGEFRNNLNIGRNIANQLGNLGYNECFAVEVEMDEEVFCIRADGEAFAAFAHRVPRVGMVIIPATKEFLVLETITEDLVVAGSAEIVAKLLGRRVEDARRDFENFAADPNHWFYDSAGEIPYYVQISSLYRGMSAGE